LFVNRVESTLMQENRGWQETIKTQNMDNIQQTPPDNPIPVDSTS